MSADPPDLDENLLIERLSASEDEYHLSKGEQEVMLAALRKSVDVVKPARRPIKKLTPEEEAEKKVRLAREHEERQKEQMAKHLETLKKDASEAGDTLTKVEKLRSEFSDLRVETDRWKATRYKARSANSRVTHIEFRRTCGCCSDAGILAMPYMETVLGRVYSDPHRMEIGEGRSYSWVREFHGWETKYREAGISEEIVAKIRSYLDAELADAED